MPSTSLEADKVFEELVQEFPPELESLAREFKAFARARKIKTVAQLLRIILLYSGLDKSLRDVAGIVAMTIEEISDTAIAKRLMAANAWIKAILPRMIDLPKLEQAKDRRIIVVDGSCVQAPGAKGTQYRFHMALNLMTLEIVELIAGDRSITESLINFHLQAGDIVIGDRAYGQRRQHLCDAAEQGYDFLLRCHSDLPLINPTTREQINLIKQLAGKSALGQYSLAAEIKSEQGQQVVCGWLHAFKLPRKAATKKRRKIKAEAKKKKRNTRALTLFLAGWLVIFTTLSPEQYPAPIIAELYRCRWQVEIAIKRLKSVLDADLLRAHYKSPLAQVWLNGKMLYVLMIERRARSKCEFNKFDSATCERTLTDWRIFKLIKDETAPKITLPMFWPTQFSVQVHKALAERKRRRKLQTAPANLWLLFIAANQSSKSKSKAA